MATRRKNKANRRGSDEVDGDVIAEQLRREREVRKSVLNFKIDQFEPEKEPWRYWIQRFEMECTIACLDSESTKQLLLLARIGPEHFKMLVDQFFPTQIKEVPYDELVETLNKFYDRKVCVLSERVAFTKCFRSQDDTVRQFMAKLKSFASQCEFRQSLDERLRDQLVLGINNDGWQQEIIKQHPNFDARLADVLTTALALEQASNHQSYMRETNDCKGGSTRKINKQEKASMSDIYQKDKNMNEFKGKKIKLRKGVDCLQCGFKLHGEKITCPAQGKECLACSKVGHFARTCISTKRAEVIWETKTKESGSKQARFVSRGESSSESSDSEIRKIGELVKGTKAMITVLINGEQLEMLYDPGASHSVITKQVWNQVGKPYLKQCKPLVAYTEIPIRTLGKSKVEVTLDGKTLKLPVYVIKDPEYALFGLNWSLAFNLPMPKGIRICSVKEKPKFQKEDEIAGNKEELNSLIKEFGNLF